MMYIIGTTAANAAVMETDQLHDTGGDHTVAPTRVSPLHDFTPLWDAMDRFITDGFSAARGWTDWSANGPRALPVELYETPDQFVVRAYAPGVMPDDLAVEYDGGMLTIRAKTAVPELKDGWRTYLAEFPYGEFIRQLRLPRTIDVDAIESKFEHGILTLVLPKTAESKPRRIEIKAPAQLGTGTAA